VVGAWHSDLLAHRLPILFDLTEPSTSPSRSWRGLGIIIRDPEQVYLELVDDAEEDAGSPPRICGATTAIVDQDERCRDLDDFLILIGGEKVEKHGLQDGRHDELGVLLDTTKNGRIIRTE
jgi:hypothetical protein